MFWRKRKRLTPVPIDEFLIGYDTGFPRPIYRRSLLGGGCHVGDYSYYNIEWGSDTFMKLIMRFDMKSYDRWANRGLPYVRDTGSHYDAQEEKKFYLPCPHEYSSYIVRNELVWSVNIVEERDAKFSYMGQSKRLTHKNGIFEDCIMVTGPDHKELFQQNAEFERCIHVL